MPPMILALNAGSSSLKFALYERRANLPLLVKGGVASLNANPRLRLSGGGEPARQRDLGAGPLDIGSAVEIVADEIRSVADISRLQAVGHRIVHGGRTYRSPAFLDDGAVEALRRLVPLAPTHQPQNLEIVERARKLFPAATQVGCFDTAFHSGRPAVAKAYGARGSTFRLRQVASDVDLVSTALAARYVLSGVIENPGRSIAVTLELTDSSAREIVWADRLVAPVDAIGELRSRIVGHLVSALEVHIPFNEARLARLSDPAGLDAWANYHIGLGHLYRFTAGDNELAKRRFEQAIVADPHLARAHAGLSFTSFLEAFLRLTVDPQKAARDARRHAERALELDPLDPFANFTMGRTFWLTDEPDIAADWLARATTLNPNYAQGFYASAFTAMLTGEAPTAFAALDTSLHLSPLDPLLYGIHGVRAQMLIQQEDYDSAAGWADRAATTPGAHYLIAMIALVCNGLAERHEQAARWRQTIRRLKPDARSADYFAAFPTREATSRARIVAELRRQGF